MKLATVRHKDLDRVVAELPDARLLDLALAAEKRGEDAGVFSEMLRVIETQDTSLDLARALLADADEEAMLELADVSFRTPIMPVQYRDCLVFEEHLTNCFMAMEAATGNSYQVPPVWYDQPIYYKGNRFSFIGHGEDVLWPSYAEFLDVELEMAIVVGRRGKDLDPKDAHKHIFGYTILNDVSARDAQMKEMPGQLGPAKGKDFDTGNILGPFILTADEVPHPVALQMDVRVNGERWGGGNSRAMQHDFGTILAHITASETVYPGEVIGSGTVGTGCGLEIGKRLAPGDRFELEIERIGVLANRIVKE